MASPCTCLPMCSAWREGNHVFFHFAFELFIRVLLIYGFMDFQLRRTCLFWEFPLAAPTLQNLQTWRSQREMDYGKCQKKRQININQFVFKGVINDDLKLAWTKQVLSFPQPSFREVPNKFQLFFCTNMVQNYIKPNLHRKEVCFVLQRMTVNRNIRSTALFQLVFSCFSGG